jgi:hypothetical protein
MVVDNLCFNASKVGSISIGGNTNLGKGCELNFKNVGKATVAGKEVILNSTMTSSDSEAEDEKEK